MQRPLLVYSWNLNWISFELRNMQITDGTPSYLPTIIPFRLPACGGTEAGRRCFPSFVRERVDLRSGGISLRSLAQAKLASPPLQKLG